jgi:COP9 signalosome complex subunit 5
LTTLSQVVWQWTDSLFKFHGAYIFVVLAFIQNADYMTAQIFDLTDKLEQSENHLGRGSFVSSIDGSEKTEDKLTKATKDRFELVYYS